MTQKIKCRDSYLRGYNKGQDAAEEERIRRICSEKLDSLNVLDERLITEALIDLQKKYNTEFISSYVRLILIKLDYNTNGDVLENDSLQSEFVVNCGKPVKPIWREDENSNN